MLVSLSQIYVPPKNPSHINSNFDIFTESSALFLHNNDHRLYLAIYSYTYLIGINEHITFFSNCIPSTKHSTSHKVGVQCTLAE